MVKFKLLAASILLLILIGATVIIFPYYKLVTQVFKISLVKLVFSAKTVRTINNKVGILVLGIAGGNHDGPNLSDSITVAEYDFSTNRLTTIGVPRDIWSDTLKEKINAAYAFGEAKQAGGGMKLAKAEIGAVVGIPIQYAVVIDFQKFKELIDYLGGIEVKIDHGFTDTEFPIEGKENDPCGGDPEYRCRYETISFNPGILHLDGQTALKFVRSRHAQGDEGTDFARSHRQQLVLQAIKEKILTIIKSKDTKKITDLYDEVDSLVTRDMSNQQAATIAKNIILKKNFTQKSANLSESIFEVPEYSLYEGRYVLLPQNGDFNRLHQYVNCVIDKDAKSCKY